MGDEAGLPDHDSSLSSQPFSVCSCLGGKENRGGDAHLLMSVSELMLAMILGAMAL